MNANLLAVVMKNIQESTAPGFLTYWTQYCPKNLGNLNMLDCTEQALREWNNLSYGEQDLFLTCTVMSGDNESGHGGANLPLTRKTPTKAKKPRKPKVTKSSPAAARLNITRSNALKRKQINREINRKINRELKLYRNSTTYLNFMRSFITKFKEMEENNLLTKAAAAWVALSEEEKNLYRRGANKALQKGSK